MKIFSIIAFALIILAQWFVPLSIILKKETITSKGKLFKFKTEPIDPSNPFEGKYITLNYQQDTFSIALNTLPLLERGDDIYILLKQENGFAVIKDVVTKKPNGNIDYVKATVRYIDNNNDVLKLYIDYSFNKFFMQEYKAPKAESLYRDANRNPEVNCYAVVSIYDGSAVVNDVMINEVSISKLVK